MLISYSQALQLLKDSAVLLPSEPCSIEDSAGRILREEILADRDLPPYDRVMMDGYALRLADLEKGTSEWQIKATIYAGEPTPPLPEDLASCFAIMTGAVMPKGADLLIPIEDSRLNAHGSVSFSSASSHIGKWLHRKGSDASKGQSLLSPFLALSSKEIAIAASCGYSKIEVTRSPRIAIISTGDELVAVDQAPLDHQVRRSNGLAVQTALHQSGYRSTRLMHVSDDVHQASPLVSEAIVHHDLVFISGAISKGAKDWVPSCLNHFGAEQLFHGVAQRPGKPAGAWFHPQHSCWIITLPGNPVSAITTLHALGLPLLKHLVGNLMSSERYFQAPESFPRLEGFTHHLPVHILNDGRLEAMRPQNSGDFVKLITSDGFITLPPQGKDADKHCIFTAWK